MNPVTHLMTTADLEKLPADGKRFYELVKGELRTMPPAGGEHGFIGVNISGPLYLHVRAKRLGVVLAADTGFVLERDPDTVLAPDVAFVRNERIPALGVPRSYWPGAPDLAVEIISPSDSEQKAEEKALLWLDAGTKLVWLVNPRRRTVTVYRSATDTTVLSDPDTLDGEGVIPGFRLTVADIFNGTP